MHERILKGRGLSVQGEREKANIAVDLSLLKHYGVSILQEKWVHERREVDEVIDLVVVDSIIHKEVLNHELLDACFQYAKEKGTYQYEVLFKKLQQYYSDKKLAVLFVEAGKSSNLLEHSNELVKLLHQKWRQTSLYVQFRRLELSNKTPSTLLESSPLLTWVEYGNLLNVEPYQFLLDTMLPTNSFSLAKTLADHRAGKNGAIVIDLEDIMLNKWVEDAGNTGDGVFELLQIKQQGKELLLGPLWDTWIFFMTKKYDEGAEDTAYKVLQSHLRLGQVDCSS
ncbi:unnamed protein product [Peronospora belbahrii]|uniref:Uncharacterized protein n=1 Tax=Peronospora belbahrii TaxID=622444 RepID=A0AAU9KW82_9STRA|nr:unnamed protein product [Peronospora belbahrii]